MSEINIENVFKQIKKQNGEGVAKVIRKAVLLGIPNIVHILEFAGSNPEEVEELVPVIHETYNKRPESVFNSDKDPFTLLKEAGYDAFVAETLEQKNSIKDYFRPGEEICTFNDDHRHQGYYIIHAIKHNARSIQPSAKPDRQDEYGTSVISIQIPKTGGAIKITNRYNHTIKDKDPDATFNCNPDNIIPGLSESLKKYFDVDFNYTDAILPNNYRSVNDQFLRYNYETNGVCFGDNYYFTGNEITKLNNDYQYMLDYFILDTKTSQIINPSKTEDSAFKVLQQALSGKKIKIMPDPENKNEKMFFADGQHIVTVCDGQITESNLPDVQHIDNMLAKL